MSKAFAALALAAAVCCAKPQQAADGRAERAARCFLDSAEGRRVVAATHFPLSQPLRFRYAAGAVPGTSGGGEGEAEHVLAYDAAKTRALFVPVVSCDVVDVAELARRNGRLEVTESNGGPPVYEAITRYVVRMETEQPEKTLRR